MTRAVTRTATAVTKARLRLISILMNGSSGFLRRRGIRPAGLVELVQPVAQLLIELRVLFRVPVTSVAGFACLIQIFARVPQLARVAPPDDVHDFESDVS